MLEAKDICYDIGDKAILRGVSATFQAGELSVIVGPNGSGKSTFLRILSSEYKSTSGTVLFGHDRIETIDQRELARKRAVLSQHIDLLFPLTVLEIVLMGRYPHFAVRPSRQDYDIAEAALERVGALSFRDRNYLTLSGGEQQMVQFARILSQVWEKESSNERYLLLDEPTTFLDLRHQHELLRMAMSVAKEGAVVIAVLHDINLAAQYADAILALKDGSVLAHGTTNDVIQKEILETLYSTSLNIIPPYQPAFPIIVSHVAQESR